MKKLKTKKEEINLKELDTYFYEKELIKEGITLIAGVDEVGRGPLIGPVVAASVIMPLNFDMPGLTDSKKLSEKKRDELYTLINEQALAIGVGIIDEKIIDEVNIYQATKLAMKEAINQLSIKPEHILIDAMPLELDIKTTSIIKGDLKSKTISAASIIAKVVRDNLVYDLAKKYPNYDLENNKGYPTKKHLEAIKLHGIVSEHRKTFGPVKKYIDENKIS